MKSQHQMSEIECNAFEEHCRASETYKTVKLDLYAEKLRWLKAIEPTGEMALEDFDRWAGSELEQFDNDDSRYKIIKVKGYDNGKSSPKYFWEHWSKHLQESVNEIDDKHHNGYFQQRYIGEEK
tara:strand:+ start:4151 stop:4522 length:372 start_codon:yes stop_codon:yes gene_type:complete